MSWGVSSNPLEFEEAVAWFRGKLVMTDDQYRRLAADAKRKAFTVAGVAQADVVQAVFNAIDKSLRDGTSFAEFQRQIGPVLAPFGVNGHALETIYRTNMQAAYGAGRYKQMTEPDVLKARPVWVFDAVLDRRTSKTCQSLNGLTLPANDPAWNGRIPPLHHRCRSGIRNIRAEDAQLSGAVPALEGADGFGQPPGMDEWQPDLRRYDSKVASVLSGILAGVEQQPRLTENALPSDGRVPNDKLLRGASPQEIIGALRSHLENTLPLHKPFTLQIAENQEDIFEIQNRWIKKAAKVGENPEKAIIEDGTRAAKFMDDLYISPQVVQQLRGTIWERALAATTICHEWWHFLRKENKPFKPFEEGSAEFFAQKMIEQFTGAKTPNAVAYQDFYEGVQLLVNGHGEEWLFKTRSSPSVVLYLQQTWLAAGYKPDLVAKALNPEPGFIWLEIVRAMIASR
jgi:SPP1 gp7 family putative phage head morphogenesis protein